jgi:hypothetical protein
LFPCRCRSRQRENSGPNNRANTDAGKIERRESTLQLALGRRRLGHQVLRALRPEKLKGHCSLLVRNSIQTWMREIGSESVSGLF